MIRHKYEQKIEKPAPLQRKKTEFFSTPIGEKEVHKMEAEYEELRPEFWQKVSGTEKVIRPANDAELEEIEKKKKEMQAENK